MARYFDQREGREKSIPDCRRHGLRWDDATQRCEAGGLKPTNGIGMAGWDGYEYLADDYWGEATMDEYYWEEAYLMNGGGGGGDYFDYTYYGDGGGDFYYGYGFDSGYEPIDYAPPFEFEPIGDDFFGLPYEGFEPLPFEPLPGELPSLDSTLDFETAYYDWLAFGLDPDSAAYFATLDLEQAGAGEGVIRISGAEAGAGAEPVLLPELQNQFFPLPYVDPWWAYMTPPVIEDQFFPLPPPPGPQKLGPCDTPNGLPGYCPQGQYHPNNAPCSCVPFPAQTTQQPQRPRPDAQAQTPRPQTPQPTPRPQAPRPQAQPQQQPCPTGQWRNPVTGRCESIPACSTGYVFDPRQGRCVLPGQVSPLPIPGEVTTTLADLGKLPWWFWLAAGGLLLVSMSGGEDRRTTTVRYKRGGA